MSLAGVDPTAMNGTPGSAMGTTAPEPVIEMKESNSTKTQEIDHTNISLGLDILHKQYIYNGTYTWKTTDEPGSVIALFAIHPDSCNAYTAHVYQMFNAWVGGMKTRIRIIGTAFYGGGLFFVRIPPNFTSEDIEKMNLTNFTSFPHTDMDPKNLESIDVNLEDYRAQHFHSGPLDLSNANSFAGWLAIVVNARLVTQSDAIHAIDLRVDMAGNFKFQVAAPIRAVQSQATGPLSDRSLVVKSLKGCDDISSVMNSTQLVGIANTQNKWTNGNVFCQAFGNTPDGEWTFTGLNSVWATAGAAADEWSKIVTMARQKHLEASTAENSLMPIWFTNGNDSNKLPFSAYHAINAGSKMIWMPINFRYGSNNGTTVLDTTGVANWGTRHITDIFFFTDAINIYLNHQAFTSGESATVVMLGQLATDHVREPMDIDDMKSFFVPISPDPAIGSESYVGVETNNGHTLNAQAAEWGADIRAFSSWPEGQAALYKGFSAEGTLSAFIKFRKNGLAYTAALPASISLNVATLRFEQWVPENDAIPLTPNMTVLMTNALALRTYRKLERKMYRRLDKGVAGTKFDD